MAANEPQTVMELLIQTRDNWALEGAACDDDSQVERQELATAVSHFADEYGDADYPRREVIERVLREMIQRHGRLPKVVVPEGFQLAADQAVEPAPAPAIADSVADDDAGDNVDNVADVTPVANPSVDREADATEAATPPVTASPLSRPEPEPATAPPHPSAEADEARAATSGAANAERPSAASPMGPVAWVSAWACRGYEGVYGFLNAEVLAGTRAARLAELGGRVQDLVDSGRGDQVTADEAVGHMLAQVEQVDAAIRANQARRGLE